MSHNDEPLDHYGRMARTWWETHRPTELRTKPDPTEFLTHVSREVQQQIAEVQAELQANLPPGLDYLDQVAAIRHTQTQAEELVLQEWFPENGRSPRFPLPPA